MTRRLTERKKRPHQLVQIKLKSWLIVSLELKKLTTQTNKLDLELSMNINWKTIVLTNTVLKENVLVTIKKLNESLLYERNIVVVNMQKSVW